MTKSKFFAAAAIALTMGSAAHAESITAIAAADARFSTLVAAVTAAGLAETLAGPGNFTVYAPVNDAFAALPAGTVETLLKPENKGQLTDILLYHVDDRVLMAGDFANGSNYYKPLLTSQRLCVSKSAAGVTIDDGTGTLATKCLRKASAKGIPLPIAAIALSAAARAARAPCVLAQSEATAVRIAASGGGAAGAMSAASNITNF